MNRAACLPALAAAALIGMTVLNGCATPTPYHAASPTDPAHADGYRELRLEPDRWRVVFAGNSLTSRETVETYLLYRAAELTLENGYDWFEAVERETDEQVTLTVQPNALAQSWEPHWRYADRLGPGWRAWDRHGLEPAFDVRQVTAYEAFAEIVMGRGAKPADDPRAFDARALMSSVEARIFRPVAR